MTRDGVSGSDALRVFVEIPATAHIPAIALSANAMPFEIGKGLEAGFFCYPIEPNKVNEIMLTLEAALKFPKLPEAAALEEVRISC